MGSLLSNLSSFWTGASRWTTGTADWKVEGNANVKTGTVQGSRAEGVLRLVADRRQGAMADQDRHFAVLYVDSCEPSRRAFHLVCQGQLRVFTTSTNVEALNQLEEHKREVGVVVAARCMPTQSGTWLLQRLRERHPPIVRLLASDGCSLAAEEAALQDGTAEGIIPIPWEPAELKERLRLELERFTFQRGGARGTTPPV